MAKIVPYLSEERIERDAVALLAEYAQKLGVVIQAPIPIEDIVEKHLRLRVEFDDTHKRHGIPRLGHEPDILGMINFDERRIIIDETLDPVEYPAKEGRYRFTLGHEGGGHWRLHRHLFVKDPSQLSLFGGPPNQSVVCRISQAREPVEWQADFYASCLLMPRALVMKAWRERFGDMNPRILERQGHILPISPAASETTTVIRKYRHESDEDALNRFARPFAEKFLVSMAAMRIRLEQVGLLHREMPGQRSLVVYT